MIIAVILEVMRMRETGSDKSIGIHEKKTQTQDIINDMQKNINVSQFLTNFRLSDNVPSNVTYEE